MVQDSFVNIFSGNVVSVAGVDVAGGSDIATDSIVRHFVDSAHITFPIVKTDSTIRKSYGVAWDGMVVIDKNGIVQFVRSGVTSSFDKTVCDAAAEVRSLLKTAVFRPGPTASFAGRMSNHRPRYYLISGQTIPHSAASATAGIAVRRFDGRVAKIVQLNESDK
jgi:hypothetical protein